jgi:acyl-CoA dehydrogenase
VSEAKAIREKVRKWVHEECIPAEKELDSKPLGEVLGKLRAKARAQGLWCPFAALSVALLLMLVAP